MPLPIPARVVRAHPDWEATLAWENEAGGTSWRLTAPDGRVRFAKVAPRGFDPPLADEAVRLEWAAAYLPVPRLVLAGDDTDGRSFLVTEGLPGEDATTPAQQDDPLDLVQRLAAALRAFHEAPVAACPFDYRLDTALARVEQRVADGRVDPARDFHAEFAHLSAADALAQLQRTHPAAEDLVVCHGDFCLPNVLFARDATRDLVGFVDLGELGVADRWWDLAVASWSITWNLGPGFEDAFLAACGVARDDARITFYRLLYDLAS